MQAERDGGGSDEAWLTTADEPSRTARLLATQILPGGAQQSATDGSHTGSYTWTVTAAAADGTDDLVQVDGPPGVTGNLVVS